MILHDVEIWKLWCNLTHLKYQWRFQRTSNIFRIILKWSNLEDGHLLVFDGLRMSSWVLSRSFNGPRHCARGERGEGRERGVFWKMHLENAMTKVWDSMRWDEQICRYRMIQDTGRLYRVEMIHKIRLKSYQIMFNVLFSPLLRPRFCKTKHSVFSTSPASKSVCKHLGVSKPSHRRTSLEQTSSPR